MASEFYWIALQRRWNANSLSTGTNPFRKYNADNLQGMVGVAIEMEHPSIAYIARRDTHEKVWESSEYRVRKEVVAQNISRIIS